MSSPTPPTLAPQASLAMLLRGELAAPAVASPDPLDAQLGDVVRSARRAWPSVALAPEAFIAHLARHAPAGIAIEAGLARMHTDDLYLACACALGIADAVRAFEHHCLPAVEVAVVRFRAASDLVAEVKQRVRERALVAGDGSPRISGFSGRGDLRSWVRAMAAREAIEVLRGARREAPADDDTALHALVAPGDVELEHAKAHYLAQFKQAFSAALRSLSPRDQTLLRQHVVDGLTIDELGALYQMHRATAARSLERARAAVLEATRAQLGSVLQVRPSELDSILRLIRSRIEVTLRGLMRRRRRGHGEAGPRRG
jgi:RNA polymerase sigma-70 factor (ECF subfamily)